MRSSKNSLCRALFALATLLAYLPTMYANDLTAVDAQGVIYDKIPGNGLRVKGPQRGGIYIRATKTEAELIRF